MKTTFPRLASLCLACWGCCAAVLAQQGQRPPAEAALQTAIQSLERYETVVAKLRQRTDLFGHQVAGSGRYVQGPTRYNLVRLELSLQLGDRASNVLQICDGKQLWMHRDLMGSLHLTCLDAQRVLEARARQKGANQRTAVEGLGLGGLPRLLGELLRSFRFEQMQEANLGSMPVRVVMGQWRPEKLAGLLPSQAAQINAGKTADLTELPRQLPDQVLVYLGRDDLFPYRVEYRRRDVEEGDEKGNAPKTIMVMELYEVQINAQVDPLQFVFNPGTAKYLDVTEAYLSSRGMTAP